MKAKEIQEILDFIAASGLAEVNIETEQFKIAVKRHSELPANVLPVTQQVVQPLQPVVQQTVATTKTQEKVEKSSESSTGDNSKIVTVKSPMIGTFYRASGPDTPAFANVGDEIKKGQVVCIIEAMKLFNEIESEYEGRIVKVLVENASPVEFDQPLFQIELK